MLVRRGTVTHGYYIKNEWIDRTYTIEARGENTATLNENMDNLTIMHTQGGTTNILGNSTETEHIKWDSTTSYYPISPNSAVDYPARPMTHSIRYIGAIQKKIQHIIHTILRLLGMVKPK